MSSPRQRRAALFGIAILLAPGPGAATGGAYAESAHGSPTDGVLRIPGERRGSCVQCHTARASGGGEGPGLHDARARGRGLLDDGLCLECHVQSRPGASFRGGVAYDASAHATSTGVVWPERRTRARQEPGRCVACHDPHAVKDATGIVPRLLRARGERLCLGCHDGDPAKDVASTFTRTYRHPLVADVPGGAASAAGGGDATPDAQAGTSPARGPGTCGGCHNPHVVRRDAAPTRPPLASGGLAGVERVRISNGPPGTPIGYTLLGPEDDTPAREYEVCLRCHSGFARRPPKLVDVAASLNPQNVSFHPVEERGRNRGIDRRAFSAGWSADSLVLCTDCHSTDMGETRGPHGSAYAHILKKPYAAATGLHPVRDGDLCFDCHAFATYAAAGAGQAASYSRFTGHPSHVARGSSCFVCHDAHGSAELPALLTLRSPGLTAFVGDATGGSCTTTCHRQTAPTTSYQVPHAR